MEELLARWSARNQLSNPPEHKLDIQDADEGSDRHLHLLPFDVDA